MPILFDLHASDSRILVHMPNALSQDVLIQSLLDYI